MPQTRPVRSGRPVALFVFSNLREQKGGLTKAFLRRLAIFHGAGWDTHVATIHPQPEIDGTLAAWRARGWLPEVTQVHHYQRRNRRFRPSWSRPTDESWTRDDRIADWLDWLVGRLPGVVVFADSPVTYAPVAMMRNPYVARVMTVHLAHRGSKRRDRAKADTPERSIYQGPAGTPKLSGRFLPFAPQADVVVALTRRQAEHLRADVPGLDVRVIPNIVDRPELGDPPARDPRLVVQLGRLDPFKRVDHALRALALARREVPDLRLAVYGRGPDQERLQAVADELGLAGAVSFEGFTDDPLHVLASAAASVMTSKREGFGLSVAESLSVGTPVVTYDIDYGPAELVRDGVNGRVVRSGSVPDLAAALVETVRDAEAWTARSAAAPAAVDRLQADVVGAQWLELAEEVASRVELPDGALLVEDLRVTREGLAVAGVLVGRDPERRPASLGPIAGEAPAPLTPSDGVLGPAVSGEASADLPWGAVRSWPLDAALAAWDRNGGEVPALGPGVPMTAIPDRRGIVLVGPDADGVLRRAPAGAPSTLVVAPTVARVRVGLDETNVSEAVRLRGAVRAGAPSAVTLDLTVGAPGLQLSSDSAVALAARSGEDRIRIGTVHPVPGAGQFEGELWTVRGQVAWDDDGLERLASATSAPVGVFLALGRGMRRVGPLDFAARRPVVAGSGWMLVPSESGGTLITRGAGLRQRILWAGRTIRRG